MDSLIQHRLFADLKLEELDDEHKVDNSFRRQCVQQLTEEIKQKRNQAENVFLLLMLAVRRDDVEMIQKYLTEYNPIALRELPWYIEHSPNFSATFKQAWTRLVRDHVEHDRLEEALRLCREPVVCAFLEPEATIGYLHAKMGNYKAAHSSYNIVLSESPDHPKRGLYFYNRAMAAAMHGSYEQALSHVKTAIKCTKDKPVAQFFTGRGVVLMLQGKEREAHKDFAQAIQLGDPVAHLYRGTPEDWTALRESDSPRVTGQMKFYACLKMNETQDQEFKNFKAVLEEKAKAGINSAECLCLLMLADKPKAQEHYDTLMTSAELKDIPFYLRRDFLELPLVLTAKKVYGDAKQLERELDQLVDMVGTQAPLSQSALWRTLSTTARLEQMYKEAKEGFGQPVEKIAKQLEGMTRKRPVDKTSAAVIKENKELEAYLEKHHLTLFSRYTAVVSTTAAMDLNENPGAYRKIRGVVE